MDVFLNALNIFFTTFKAAVFVPVFIFIIAVAMGVKPKKAFFSALSAGVGLEGFSLVIGSYSPILSPIINNMINSGGINLPIVDMGWQTTSIIAYSYQVGMIYIAVAIALQVILYLVHYTTVFQAGDLWNNYSYFAWGSCLFVLTQNFWLAMLKEVLTRDLIEVGFAAEDRDAAVREAGRLLVNKGFATEGYVDGMIENVEVNGTYIVIAPGIAMPHARPEKGAKGIGFSIVTLAEPVVFGHPTNDPVKLVIALCAVDHQTHLKALSELADIIADETKVRQIEDARSADEIANIIEGSN